MSGRGNCRLGASSFNKAICAPAYFYCVAVTAPVLYVNLVSRSTADSAPAAALSKRQKGSVVSSCKRFLIPLGRPATGAGGGSLLRWLLLRVNACAAHKSKGPQTAPTVFLFFGDTPTEGESLSTYRLRANPTHTCRRVFYKRNCATSLQFEWINRPFVTWWTVRRISRCPKSFTACASRYRAFEKYI